MPVFAYKALTPSAAPDAGLLVADSPRAARDQLRARGLSVESLTERAPASTKSLSFTNLKSRHGRLDPATLTSFIRELATLLGVGMPLAESLDLIAQQEVAAGGRSKLRPHVLALADRVRSGLSLAAAMRESPHVFDPLVLSITEVGETSGTLDAALVRLAEFREKSHGLRNRVATALIYPGIVLTMAIVVSILLMTVVVPNLLSALETAGRELPLPTRIVKGFSDFLVGHWLILLSATIAILVAFKLALSSAGGRQAWHRLQLRLPLFGPLFRKQAVVRLAVVMSSLLKAGVVFVRALEIAAATTTNTVIAAALREAAVKVSEGGEIGPSLAATGAFPPVVVQLFSLGQQSGRGLEEMLDRLAADYDAAVAQATTRLTALLEPALILVLVGIVGLIGFATVLPMLEAADAF